VAIALGFDPEKLTVRLSRFGDFTAGLEYDDPDDPAAGWPAGAVLELRFYANDTATVAEASWPATVDGKLATWHKTLGDVTTDVLNPGNTTARLIYITTELGTLEWAVGQPEDTR
jgi:hypothetical protein